MVLRPDLTLLISKAKGREEDRLYPSVHIYICMVKGNETCVLTNEKYLLIDFY